MDRANDSKAEASGYDRLSLDGLSRRERYKLLTGYGTLYYPDGRGIYRVLSAVWKALQAQARKDEAHAVASAFTKEDGSYAYDKA